MRTSIIILTYNQLEEGTKPCIESIYKNTKKEDFELIIVDNLSTDGTREYLLDIEKKFSNIKIKFNKFNNGFAGGNNDGIKLSKGDYIILLNNDTIVTDKWLNSLLFMLETDKNIGMVGPVTNSAGNEQRIDIEGLNENNYFKKIKQYIDRHNKFWFETNRLGFFCVAIRRDVIEKVGYLDENFGIGMFEDDDYCLRVNSAGYKIAVNEGCFIYHKGSLSFKKLRSENYNELFEKNKSYFLKKHNTTWSFSDIAFSYCKKFNLDLKLYAENNGVIDPYIESILLRFEHFKNFIFMFKEFELESKNNIKKIKWKMRIANLKMNVLKGSYIERITYLKNIVKKIWKKF